MRVVVTCKNEGLVSGEVWSKFELTLAFTAVLVIARMRKIHSKMNSLEWSQHLTHCKSMGIFKALKGNLLCSMDWDLV